MYGYFEFKAEVYFDGNSYIEKGVTFAETYAGAVDYIEDYYGEDLVSLSIQAIEPYNVYILEGPTKVTDNFFKEEKERG